MKRFLEGLFPVLDEFAKGQDLVQVFDLGLLTISGIEAGEMSVEVMIQTAPNDSITRMSISFVTREWDCYDFSHEEAEMREVAVGHLRTYDIHCNAGDAQVGSDKISFDLTLATDPAQLELEI